MLKSQNFKEFQSIQNLQNPKNTRQVIKMYGFETEARDGSSPLLYVRFVNLLILQMFLLLLGEQRIDGVDINPRKGELTIDSLKQMLAILKQKFQSQKAKFQQINDKEIQKKLKKIRDNKKIVYYHYGPENPTLKDLQNQKQKLFLFVIQEKDHYLLTIFTAFNEEALKPIKQENIKKIEKQVDEKNVGKKEEEQEAVLDQELLSAPSLTSWVLILALVVLILVLVVVGVLILLKGLQMYTGKQILNFTFLNCLHLD